MRETCQPSNDFLTGSKVDPLQISVYGIARFCVRIAPHSTKLIVENKHKNIEKFSRRNLKKIYSNGSRYSVDIAQKRKIVGRAPRLIVLGILRIAFVCFFL